MTSDIRAEEGAVLTLFMEFSKEVTEIGIILIFMALYTNV